MTHLLFWYQVLTWVSLSPNLLANSIRSCTLRYFWRSKLFSSVCSWWSVKAVRAFRCFLLRLDDPPMPILMLFPSSSLAPGREGRIKQFISHLAAPIHSHILNAMTGQYFKVTPATRVFCLSVCFCVGGRGGQLGSSLEAFYGDRYDGKEPFGSHIPFDYKAMALVSIESWSRRNSEQRRSYTSVNGSLLHKAMYTLTTGMYIFYRDVGR